MQTQTSVSVEAEPARDVLRLTLSNHSSQVLNVYEHSLPWKGSTSIILFAVRADALGTPVAKESPIDDPGPSTVTIAPGATLSGEISLPSRFPEFEKARSERDVIVFWSYRLEPIGAPPEQRTGGYVVYPRR